MPPDSSVRLNQSAAPVNEIKHIPLSAPDLRGKESTYLARCISENWVSSAGPFVTEFEQRMALLTGRRYGVATVNGTTALHLALVVAGVRQGDLVIVPDWTFAATANAVAHAGAEPFFTDVTASTWTLDPSLVADVLRKLKKRGKRRVGAVVTVHALGHPADMDPLASLCREAAVPLIEDAAGAIGSSYKGRPAGGLSDAAIFSFNGNKTVTAGGGGMVVTDRAAWARRLRSLSTQARAGHAYIHLEVGYNYRMTNLNAAVGLAQLERLDEMLKAKRSIVEAYEGLVQGRQDLRSMPRAAWAESNCWMYGVQCASPSDALSLIAYLQRRNIEARVFWMALSSQKPYRDYPRLLAGVAKSLSGRVVVLPAGSGLTPAQQTRILEALAGWRGKPCKQVA